MLEEEVSLWNGYLLAVPGAGAPTVPADYVIVGGAKRPLPVPPLTLSLASPKRVRPRERTQLTAASKKRTWGPRTGVDIVPPVLQPSEKTAARRIPEEIIAALGPPRWRKSRLDAPHAPACISRPRQVTLPDDRGKCKCIARDAEAVLRLEWEEFCLSAEGPARFRGAGGPAPCGQKIAAAI